ncbi:MAG: lactonase family protein [Bacteroidales bacterium]|nr:lactonase family protein [Bacteroidales bacterium]
MMNNNYEKVFPDSESIFLLVSSYSNGKTPGISIYEFSKITGEAAYANDMKGLEDPSFITVSPDNKFVYSAHEIENSTVSSFAFDKKTATLNFMNEEPTKSSDSCFINVNPDQSFLVVANYSGNISVLPLNDDGTIGPVAQVMDFKEDGSEESHIHTVVFSPDNKYLLATDLGKNKIYQLEILSGENKEFLKLIPSKTLELEKGSGPRHLAFHPNGVYLYCINELSGTVTVFEKREDNWNTIQTLDSDITEGDGDKGGGDIHLTPDGKFLYTSNRLEKDGISIFSVDPSNGKLTRMAYQRTGIHPRNFILSPDGKFLLCANMESNNIQIFAIDSYTGLLKDTGQTIDVEKPVCLQWI